MSGIKHMAKDFQISARVSNGKILLEVEKGKTHVEIIATDIFDAIAQCEYIFSKETIMKIEKVLMSLDYST